MFSTIITFVVVALLLGTATGRGIVKRTFWLVSFILGIVFGGILFLWTKGNEKDHCEDVKDLMVKAAESKVAKDIKKATEEKAKLAKDSIVNNSKKGFDGIVQYGKDLRDAVKVVHEKKKEEVTNN